MKKGGRIFNHGYKGIVMSVYNISGRDKKTLYKEIEENGKEGIQLIGINDKKRIRVVGDEIDRILEMIKENGSRGDVLVKKFVYANIFDTNENNFKNEMRGYLQLFRIFGRDVEKYTTIKAGFVYRGIKKLVDWDLSTSFNNRINMKKVSIFRNGSSIYNHPIKFENTGISYLIYDMLCKMETILSNRYKYIEKLISPILIRDKIRESMEDVRKINEENGRGYYVKYYDKYSFALCILFIGEYNNIQVDNKWINNILSKFGIILKFK